MEVGASLLLPCFLDSFFLPLCLFAVEPHIYLSFFLLLCVSVFPYVFLSSFLSFFLFFFFPSFMYFCSGTAFCSSPVWLCLLIRACVHACGRAYVCAYAYLCLYLMHWVRAFAHAHAFCVRVCVGDHSWRLFQGFPISSHFSPSHLPGWFIATAALPYVERGEGGGGRDVSHICDCCCRGC